MDGIRPANGRKKTTGVYGADLVPGTYVKTLTGTTRGEELFCRPDLERPWRSAATQKRASDMALKEREIEELMRLCSNLRTELGNARSDARYLEYEMSNKTSALLAEKDEQLKQLTSKVASLEEKLAESQTSTEAQIRLLKSQHENELLSLKSEARLAGDRATDVAATSQKQMADVRAACAEEVKFIENRFKARSEELEAELKAQRDSAKAAEAHHETLAASSKALLERIESDYKERLRAAEQRVEEVRKQVEADLASERAAKEAALAEVGRSVERLAAATLDKEELAQKCKSWNSFILLALDRFYLHFVETMPEHAVEPADPQVHQLPVLYGPRAVLEDPEAKVTLERVVFRLLQLRGIKLTSLHDPATSGVPASASGVGADGPGAVEAEVARLEDRQERLRRAVQETRVQCEETDAAVSSALSRLNFFSANLRASITTTLTPVLPPLRNVVFVLLTIPQGVVLWAAEPEAMRTAVMLLYNTVRLKLGEYGAYESYSDDVCMLLALSDPAAAVRLCCECQEWLLVLPWPERVLASPLCPTEAVPGGGGPEGRALFRGLRVGMTLHAGEAFVEPTALPGAQYRGVRCHYYGRAVSQLVHAGSLTQGGQIIATQAAWALCLQHRHELGQIAVTQLGSFPILSLNSDTGETERQSLELLQVSPWELRDRQFRPTPRLELPAVPALAGATRSLLAAELEALQARRAALAEARELLADEHASVAAELAGLGARLRALAPRFHLLPPPEMVDGLNDVCAVVELIASRSEGLASDLAQLAAALEDAEAQGEGLREYFARRAVDEGREEDLRAELEAANQRSEEVVRDMGARARREAAELRATLQEKEQTIRRLVQAAEAAGGMGASLGHPAGASGSGSGGRSATQVAFVTPTAASGGRTKSRVGK